MDYMWEIFMGPNGKYLPFITYSQCKTELQISNLTVSAENAVLLYTQKEEEKGNEYG